MAEACANNNSRNVWGELKKMGGTRKGIPPHVDGNHSYKDICELFLLNTIIYIILCLL